MSNIHRNFLNVKNTSAVLLLLFSSVNLLAQSDIDTTIQSKLNGEWTIDLRPTPDADEYLKTFLIELNGDNQFGGEFYDSDIQDGLINTSWDKVHLGFYTQDASSNYYHSAYLLNDTIYGMSYCPDRAFVAPWWGIKK